MTHSCDAQRLPLGTLLSRLRIVLQKQADALSADDFDGLERLDAVREQLVAALGLHTPADIRPEDRALLAQVEALDQRLLAVARESFERTGQELREVHRGRGALSGYRQRGQNLIQNLALLDQDR